ncbi:unnamed protein product [Moneuplotes crassus]|uniref:Purple acid phosphatase n=1 Tax=Euplotes crassus TaxID=5936 RepID=A0AAD1X5C6_EUPCR|nr:unnamed protein product [Moneuplotes crassus]
MYENLPILRGMYFTMFQYYIITAYFALTVAILGTFVTDIILNWALHCTKPKNEIEYEFERSEPDSPCADRNDRIQSYEQSNDMNSEEDDIMPIERRARCGKTRCKGISCLNSTIKVLIIVLEILLALLILGYLDLLLVFDIIEGGLKITSFKFLLFMSILICLLIRFYEKFEPRKCTQKIISVVFIVSLPLIFALFYAQLTFIKGFCLCIWNQATPGLNHGEGHLSSAYTRSHMPSTCPVDETPCLLYVTLPENSLNEVFINFHVNVESCEGSCTPTLLWKEYTTGLDLQDSSNWNKFTINASDYESPKNEYSKRYIYTAYMKSLKPNTRYVFQITSSSWKSQTAKTYVYKTFDESKIVIVDGGDVGNSHITETMNKNTVSKIEMDLIMLGGDIAYDNNIAACYRSWDYLIKRLPQQRTDPVTGLTRLIPTIYGVGNHDMGINPYNGAKITHNANEPAFKHYFPQNTYDGKIPYGTDRKSYSLQKIGNLLEIYSLDTGYDTKMEGEQMEWMILNLERNSATYRFAQYHGPVYSACKQDAHFDHTVSDKGKKYWIPIFDRYNMTIVFENHTHSFKRSKRIKNGKEDSTGTLYLGEGNWGVKKPSGVCVPENADLHVKSTLDNNIWKVEVTPTGIIATAYNENNEQLDRTTIDV